MNHSRTVEPSTKSTASNAALKPSPWSISASARVHLTTDAAPVAEANGRCTEASTTGTETRSAAMGAYESPKNAPAGKETAQ